ncbi:MAG TPA: hypothetical protein VF743_07425 [Acidimicrobiales bacterium]
MGESNEQEQTMRLLKRQPDEPVEHPFDHLDEQPADEPAQPVTHTPSGAVSSAEAEAVDRRIGLFRGRRRDVDDVSSGAPAGAAPAVPGTTEAEEEADEAERRRPSVFPTRVQPRRERVDDDRPTVPTGRVDDTDRMDGTNRDLTPGPTGEIVVRRWSWADAVVALIGAGITLIGVVAMTRAGVDSSWYRPRVEVLDAQHTALLGAIEAGVGALLMLTAVFRLRILSTLIGLGMVVAGAYAAIESGELYRELAIEDWWALSAAGVGVLVVLLGLAPRRARVERVPVDR